MLNCSFRFYLVIYLLWIVKDVGMGSETDINRYSKECAIGAEYIEVLSTYKNNKDVFLDIENCILENKI